ncbi:MAG TPA: hypothetical protein VFA20_34850 [Myxococcaceae bacterium]|nr:hypothetical protein [Myxococcaceae bacterium]
MSMRFHSTPTPRRILPFALGAAALVAAALACTQTTPPQPGGVSGTYDLARVGDYVFVTSADLSELRVIDAHADGGPNGTGPHDWVRAPNPLEALEIPVVQRPVGLTRDVNYTDVKVDDVTPVGGEVTGPYVYAFADGRPEISVVGADPASLVEVKRLTTDGPVTAASAQGPSGPVVNSTLFYATLVGGTGNLYSVSLAPLDQIAGQTPAPQLLLRMDAGEAISAIQVLPRHQELAVATRSTEQQAVSGRTFALNPSSGATRSLGFGAPVRILATHPGTSDGLFQPEVNLFGVVDEESCGGAGAVGCARILTVDVNSGTPALDFSNQPALPIEFARGLPRALTFMANSQVHSNTASADAGGLADLPLMGLVTNTDGTLTFFEAVGRPVLGTEPADPDGGLPVIAPQWTLRHINQSFIIGSGSNFFYEDDAGVAITTPQQVPCGGVDAGEGVIASGIQLCSIVTGMGDGVAESVIVTFEGFIPGFTSLPTTNADGQTFPLPAGSPVGRVAVGDRIVAQFPVQLPDGDAGTGTCPDLTITSTTATSVSTTDVIPPACVGRASFGIRAADPMPYVVTGQQSGYIGRAQDQSTFQSAAGRVYYRPDPAVRDPSLPPPPALTFQMGARPTQIARDFRWVFITSAGFAPLFFQLATDSSGWPGYHLPYGVAAMPDVPKVFLSYPSVSRTVLLGSGAVIELNPTLILPNEANVQITSAYR